MFEKWSDFYVMTGGASAALIGLLFIVVTLSAASEAANEQVDLTRGHSVYASPAVFHLGVVLFVSALGLAPDLSIHSLFDSSGLLPMAIGNGITATTIIGAMSLGLTVPKLVIDSCGSNLHLPSSS